MTDTLDSASAVNPVEAVVSIAARDGKRADRQAEWDRYVATNMARLVEAYEASPASFEAQVGAAATVSGFREKVRGLLRTVRVEVERKRADVKRDMIERLEQQLSQQRPLWDSLQEYPPPPEYADAALLQSLVCPAGYKINAAGVWRGKATADAEIDWTPVLHAPLFPVSRTTDSATGEAERMLLWLTPSGWRRRQVSRGVMLDSKNLVKLASADAPVSSGNVTDAVQWLSEFEALNGLRMPAVLSTRRCGWTDDGGFVMPEEYWAPPGSGEEGLVFAPEEGMERVAAGWTVGGTLEGWIDAASLILDKPIPWLMLYGALAAPLLSLIGVPSFVIDVAGQTSGGKSTSLRFAASGVGSPNVSGSTVVFSWDTTRVGTERTLGFLNNLPLFLDETKRAKNDAVVRDVIYDFAQGYGRVRGLPGGGTAVASTWHTVLLSTGEGAAIHFSNDAGTRARVLQLRGQPMGEASTRNGEIAERVTLMTSEHYGHLMPLVVDELVAIRADPERRRALKSLYLERKDLYANGVSSGVARRIADYIAALSLVSDMLHGGAGFKGFGIPQPSPDPFIIAVDSMKWSSKEADLPLLCLQEIVGIVSARRSEFEGVYAPVGPDGVVRAPGHGWKGKWDQKADGTLLRVGVRKDFLDEMIISLGHKPADIIPRWASRGFIKTQGDKMIWSARVDSGVLTVVWLHGHVFEMVHDLGRDGDDS